MRSSRIACLAVASHPLHQEKEMEQDGCFEPKRRASGGAILPGRASKRGGSCLLSLPEFQIQMPPRALGIKGLVLKNLPF
jgi:hypothetical protein